MIQKQTVILLFGRSATGKTALGYSLNKRFKIPFISLDQIKESLYSTGFIEDRQDETLLNQISYDVMTEVVDKWASNGKSIICDLHIREDLVNIKNIAISKNCFFIPILCQISNENIRRRRYNNRVKSGERHFGHYDKLKTMLKNPENYKQPDYHTIKPLFEVEMSADLESVASDICAKILNFVND